jgi:hypothetical protein
LELLDATPPREKGEVRVLVTHVSPGKQPLVGCLAAALDADLTISGHMGAPYSCVWDEFAVREPEQAAARLAQLASSLPEPLRTRLALTGDRWYRGTFHINLPDAPDGHAVLELRNGKVRLETVSEGLRLP